MLPLCLILSLLALAWLLWDGLRDEDNPTDWHDQ